MGDRTYRAGGTSGASQSACSNGTLLHAGTAPQMDRVQVELCCAPIMMTRSCGLLAQSQVRLSAEAAAESAVKLGPTGCRWGKAFCWAAALFDPTADAMANPDRDETRHRHGIDRQLDGAARISGFSGDFLDAVWPAYPMRYSEVSYMQSSGRGTLISSGGREHAFEAQAGEAARWRRAAPPYFRAYGRRRLRATLGRRFRGAANDAWRAPESARRGYRAPPTRRLIWRRLQCIVCPASGFPVGGL